MPRGTWLVLLREDRSQMGRCFKAAEGKPRCWDCVGCAVHVLRDALRALRGW